MSFFLLRCMFGWDIMGRLTPPRSPGHTTMGDVCTVPTWLSRAGISPADAHFLLARVRGTSQACHRARVSLDASATPFGMSTRLSRSSSRGDSLCFSAFRFEHFEFAPPSAGCPSRLAILARLAGIGLRSPAILGAYRLCGPSSGLLSSAGSHSHSRAFLWAGCTLGGIYSTARWPELFAHVAQCA